MAERQKVCFEQVDIRFTFTIYCIIFQELKKSQRRFILHFCFLCGIAHASEIQFLLFNSQGSQCSSFKKVLNQSIELFLQSSASFSSTNNCYVQ